MWYKLLGWDLVVQLCIDRSWKHHPFKTDLRSVNLLSLMTNGKQFTWRADWIEALLESFSFVFVIVWIPLGCQATISDSLLIVIIAHCCYKTNHTAHGIYEHKVLVYVGWIFYPLGALLLLPLVIHCLLHSIRIPGLCGLDILLFLSDWHLSLKSF